MGGRQASGRVEEVMRRLETAMLDGSFPANARLPSERDMAEHYGVSRNTVREAVQRLAARGLVRSRRGAGVFVSDQLRTGIASPWAQLMTDHPAVREDMLEFRRVLEGATAYFAALRGSAEDIECISGLMQALEQARNTDDKETESSIDARLHDAIALASHNSMFLHLHSSIMSMLREHITLNVAGLRELEVSVPEQLLLQHRSICDAICTRRPEEARTAMQSHIDYVRSRLGPASEKA
ncbi:MAG TPA: FadR/GntR family transcriptional regulator [Noviherbaspirillum sp.]|uniref:FadR/GntR family transcriptional regulator n=1 Tax=Noviherbaspirillum sp. TaxID=1926288 RepID=UPI002B485C96|nr:FadR/GntR family transcriptional regulator [Noviherbaspirillum sp.]HJV87637.1 FadR/GntR family transcriptional regulator [Noviherbaspirillum sp.]